MFEYSGFTEPSDLSFSGKEKRIREVTTTKIFGIPSDGEYIYEVAFAEWRGQSMGESVQVFIEGNNIKIVYSGEGQIAGLKKGTIMEEGKIVRHKSGVWIISVNEEDAATEEIGGCTGGPTVIDFEHQKYWMC